MYDCKHVARWWVADDSSSTHHPCIPLWVSVLRGVGDEWRVFLIFSRLLNQVKKYSLLLTITLTHIHCAEEGNTSLASVLFLCECFVVSERNRNFAAEKGDILWQQLLKEHPDVSPSVWVRGDGTGCCSWRKPINWLASSNAAWGRWSQSRAWHQKKQFLHSGHYED